MATDYKHQYKLFKAMVTEYQEEILPDYRNALEALAGENAKLKREFEAVTDDFRAFAISVWKEDRPFPCRFCKHEWPDGRCQWKIDHIGDEEECFSKHFEWRGGTSDG